MLQILSFATLLTTSFAVLLVNKLYFTHLFIYYGQHANNYEFYFIGLLWFIVVGTQRYVHKQTIGNQRKSSGQEASL
jgi:hypothetical protein